MPGGSLPGKPRRPARAQRRSLGSEASISAPRTDNERSSPGYPNQGKQNSATVHRKPMPQIAERR